MNKEFVHRELVLHSLGYELDASIKKYLDSIENILGNIETEEVEHINGYFISSENKGIFAFYETDKKNLLMDSTTMVNIVETFKFKGFGYDNNLMADLALEHYLGISFNNMDMVSIKIFSNYINTLNNT